MNNTKANLGIFLATIVQKTKMNCRNNFAFYKIRCYDTT